MLACCVVFNAKEYIKYKKIHSIAKCQRRAYWELNKRAQYNKNVAEIIYNSINRAIENAEVKFDLMNDFNPIHTYMNYF